MKNHFTLYQGYVTNVNKTMDTLKELREADKASSSEFAEIKRRFGWEYNGMVLHELYFENIAKGKSIFDEENSELGKQMAQDFGKSENCGKEFSAVGAMRGIGWVITAFDPHAKKLFNVWINEHDVGHLTGTIPLVVMDVFEHAYLTDYGLKRADYINAFMNSIDWGVVNKRFEAAMK